MITIREFKMEDLSALTLLMKDLGYPSTLEQLRERMNNINSDPMYSTFLAEIDNKVVGMIGLRKLFSYEEDRVATQITSIVASEKHRGLGVGKTLIQYAEQYALNNKSHCLVLTSGNKPEREIAHQFYKNNGFHINGYRFFKKL